MKVVVPQQQQQAPVVQPETTSASDQPLEIPPPRIYEIVRRPNNRKIKKMEPLHFTILTPKEGVVIPTADLDAAGHDDVTEDEKGTKGKKLAT